MSEKPKTEQPKPCCAHCCWFGALPSGDSVGATGYCQRFPPVVVAAGEGTATHFPKVTSDVLCGEYRVHPKLDPVADLMRFFGLNA